MFTLITYITSAMALIFLALSFFSLNNAKSVATRFIVVILMVCGLSMSFLSAGLMLSQPKQGSIEWLHKNIEEVEIRAAEFEYKKAIYVWMLFPGETKPRYYEFEWDDEEAKQLEEAMKKRGSGRNARGKVVMVDPFKDKNSEFKGKKKTGRPGDKEKTGSDSFEDRPIKYKFIPLSKQLPDKEYELK